MVRSCALWAVDAACRLWVDVEGLEVGGWAMRQALRSRSGNRGARGSSMSFKAHRTNSKKILGCSLVRRTSFVFTILGLPKLIGLLLSCHVGCLGSEQGTLGTGMTNAADPCHRPSSAPRSGTLLALAVAQLRCLGVF